MDKLDVHFFSLPYVTTYRCRIATNRKQYQSSKVAQCRVVVVYAITTRASWRYLK
ncbi:hypothetical protein NT01EI_1231 [Edwardsiella ictaluri 93-146]|uniref:Uncharacterized protein n=1 Tax=Edwardsiella ictaluri (strain 93-146) TaxID=634503 RepID=C5B7D3_EDWI9|nr:hypothetical protein NT01EI_1231 [Edwardsiella ictaluri 93-146]